MYHVANFYHDLNIISFRESLESIFNKYGNVTAVVVNKQKGNSALVEFEVRERPQTPYLDLEGYMIPLQKAWLWAGVRIRGCQKTGFVPEMKGDV